jgi:hypothetical protein
MARLIGLVLLLAFAVAQALPILQPVPARVVGADLVGDQVADGEETQPIDIELTWATPTTNTDGSALAPSAILGYDIEHTAPLEPPAVIRVGVITTHTILNAFRGPHSFRIATVATHGTGPYSAAITVQVL